MPQKAIISRSSTDIVPAQTEPCFYQYCQFLFQVELFPNEILGAKNRTLLRVIPLMQRIVLKTRYCHPDSWFRHGDVDFVACLPMEDRTLRLRETFSKTSSQGRQMEFHIIGSPDANFETQKDTAGSALLTIFHLFRHFHTVIFYVNLYRKKSSTIFFISPKQIAEECADGLRACRSTLEPVLGPGTNVVTEKSVTDESECVYSDYTVYHPRSHFEAKER